VLQNPKASGSRKKGKDENAEEKKKGKALNLFLRDE